MENLREFFTEEETKDIVDAIKIAEKNTSGEIRVHLEKSSGKEPLKKIREIFIKIGMRKTELKNGILFFLSIEDKQFTILGDDGINKKVPKDFWDNVKNIIIENFKNGDFSKGLSEGIIMAGEQLSTFFPYEKGDINELSDNISYGDELEENKNEGEKNEK